MRFMNSAASGPTTSILPSVEASNMPQPLAHRQAFARDGGMHVLAGLREVAGALPQADILEHGAVRLRPRRGSASCAIGIEQLAALEARRSVPKVTGV